MKQNVRWLGILTILLLCSLGMGPMPGEVQEFGKTVYDQHCLRYHGTRGQGDGPQTKSLTIKPANFFPLNLA